MTAQSNPSLKFTFGLNAGETLLIKGKAVVIGRDPSADIQLESPYVSRQHAEIIFEGGYWFITDLFSKNGVFKNADRIQPGRRIPLNDRDQVQIGSISVFEFQDPEITVRQFEMRMLSRGLWLDEPNRQVYVHNRLLEPPLSQQQFVLLSALVQHSGDIMTNEAIAEVLWPGATGGVESAAIDNAISRLRARLAELDQEHEYIETVRGFGRRFVKRQ